ncbi:WD40/YVTN/BNR-like repeat-containing protein [Ruminiclostridium cellobioparum]|uniref:WD40/YVTN/BNR-like repeat-containing protein n=1 Tax=Ruminiclostridium cellobioparum TaxID=29355 RepID=UPI0028AF74E6|nr:hypothetical protein [Ruminiclostridium cellobioparum]
MKKLYRYLLPAFLILLVSVILFIPEKSSSEPWVQTNGPYGGYIHCFAIDGGNIYAGTQGGGIFLSADNGTSWKEVNSGLTNNNIYSLAVSRIPDCQIPLSCPLQ